ARTPAFSQVRLKRRRANSKGSFSRTLTLGIGISGSWEGRPTMGRSLRRTRTSRPGRPGEPRMIAARLATVQPGAHLPRMKVLGIESSCDETGVAVYDTARAGGGLLAHAVYSQIALHAEYGGVVPELASRDHVRKLLPLVRQTLAEAGLAVGDVDGVAYTAGPGLVGALLVGAGVARALAWALDVPAVGVHHMEGH